MSTFQKGDIVRVHLAPGTFYSEKVEGYDAKLIRLVTADEEAYNPEKEKWFFEMLEGPLASSWGRVEYCIVAERLSLRLKLAPSGYPPKKGLPSL